MSNNQEVEIEAEETNNCCDSSGNCWCNGGCTSGDCGGGGGGKDNTKTEIRDVVFKWIQNTCKKHFNTVVTTFDKDGQKIGDPVITPGTKNVASDDCCLASKGKDKHLL